jgi:hypothetical protein
VTPEQFFILLLVVAGVGGLALFVVLTHGPAPFQFPNPFVHKHYFGSSPDPLLAGQQIEFEGVPVRGGGHTTFIVFTCRCGAYQLFPQSNYDLATDGFKKEFLNEWVPKNKLTVVVE